MSCEDCSKREKKMKVLLSDHCFQLRKITQDKAEEKALFEIGIQKQLRKWQEKYHKQKLDHEQNSKKWINKIDQVKNTCQLKINQFSRTTQQTIEQHKEQARLALEYQRTTAFSNYQKELKKIKQTYQKEKIAIDSAHKSQVAQIQQKSFNELQKVKNQAKLRQNSMIKDYESTILGLKSSLTAQQRSNVRLQEQHRVERSKYLSQIYDNKVMICSLEETINKLKTQISLKDQQLLQKKLEILSLTEQNKLDIAAAEMAHEQLKKDYIQALETQLKQYFEKELQITHQYEDQLRKMEQKREHEQKLYQTNINQIRMCIETRPSRVQDVQQILILKEKLIKKQRQYDSLQKQAKHIQLQLQNKEDTYNKIFIPTINSAHLNDSSTIKRKELKLKRPGKSLSTVRDILNAANINTNNLPLLNGIDKKYLPPKSTKIL